MNYDAFKPSKVELEFFKSINIKRQYEGSVSGHQDEHVKVPLWET